MELYVELKLRTDDSSGGFSNGLTMCGTPSTLELEKVSEIEEEIVYKNLKNHKITLNRKAYGENLFEVSTTFENNDEEMATLDLLSSFAIKDFKADKVHRLQSFWSAEGRLKTETIEDLHLEASWANFGVRSEKFGSLGSMPVRKYFPFVVLENSETSEFMGVQLYIPSSWQMEILCSKVDSFSLVGGIADREFGHWFKNIKKGETFTTPKAMIAHGKSLQEVCDELVKVQNPNISQIDHSMGIMFNEYCTTWGNPSYENIKKSCDQLKGKGIQYFIIDAGWYSDHEKWWASIGDWKDSIKRFPDGIKEAADYIRQCGMIPGIWFEFEPVGVLSSAYLETDHLIKKDGKTITVGDRRFWDMSDPWVVDYLSQKVIGTLKECGFGYIKVDYNDNIGIGCDGAESLGEGLRQKLQASQAFFKKIKQELPEIVIENCSSGGHRLDASMMELVSQASFSDAHETTAIPIIAANLHRVIKPSQSQIWAVMRAGDSDNRIYYSMVNTFLGRMCLSGEIYDLSDAQWRIVEEGMAFYSEISDIIKNGNTIKYENSVRSYNKPQGEQILIRQLENRCLVIGHRFENSKEMNLDFMKAFKVINEYGSLNQDFSAKAWLVEEVTHNEK